MKKSAFWRMTEQTMHMNDSQFQEWLRALSDEDLKDIVAKSYYVYHASAIAFDKRNHELIQSMLNKMEIVPCPDNLGADVFLEKFKKHYSKDEPNEQT